MWTIARLARAATRMRNILRIVKDMFVDLQLVFEDVFSAGELVATRIQYKGYQAGECCGVAPTGCWVAFDALENFRVVGGKIVES